MKSWSSPLLTIVDALGIGNKWFANAQEIPRTLERPLEEKIKPGRVWMLFGARRVGKTLLVQNSLANQTDERWFSAHGEDKDVAELLSSRSADRFRQAFEAYDGFFLDEAQSVPDCGLGPRQPIKQREGQRPDTTVSRSVRAGLGLSRALGPPTRNVPHPGPNGPA